MARADPVDFAGREIARRAPEVVGSARRLDGWVERANMSLSVKRNPGNHDTKRRGWRPVGESDGRRFRWWASVAGADGSPEFIEIKQSVCGLNTVSPSALE